jgi:hypothetical protein
LTLILPRIPTSKKTEWKVRVATAATYLGALAGSIFLSSTATDYVHALPDWAENLVYPALLAGITWLSGRAAKSKPGYISASTAQAVEKAIRQRVPRKL